MERKAMIGLCVALVSLAAGVRVETPYGPVDGASGDGYEYFKGIPYAEAPVGRNRFMPPRAKEPWAAPLNATAFGPGCPAMCEVETYSRPNLMCAATTSEDCLFLNVYRPSGVDSTAKLPVLVFIPGGAFSSGSASSLLYDGSMLAKSQRLIVVTLNYRLGILGGLYTTVQKNNLQIQDQREALRFVQRAIGAFGGDPTRVTLSGHSAGAASTAVHLTSAASWEYFSAAIMMSNPAGLMLPTVKMAQKHGAMALDKLECPHGGEAELKCLQGVPLDRLQEAQHAGYGLDKALMNAMPWSPVVNFDDIWGQPIEVMENGYFSKVPVLLGTTANESVMFLYSKLKKPTGSTMYVFVMETMLHSTVGTRALLKYSPVPANDRHDTRKFMSVIGTDYLFYCPVRYMASMMSQGTRVFVYLFDKVASWNAWAYNHHVPYCVNEVCHGSDIPFVLNSLALPSDVVNPPKPTPAEEKLINDVQTMWGNFVRDHDPGTLPDGVTMRPYDASLKNMLNLSTPVSELDGYRSKYCDFWDEQGYVRY